MRVRARNHDRGACNTETLMQCLPYASGELAIEADAIDTEKNPGNPGASDRERADKERVRYPLGVSDIVSLHCNAVGRGDRNGGDAHLKRFQKMLSGRHKASVPLIPSTF